MGKSLSKPTPPTFRGRSIGIVALTTGQLLIGIIHAFFGGLLLVSENFLALPTTVAYDIYTLVYGLLVIVFAAYFWAGRTAGWVGTIAVSIFVITADSLTLLDLPSIPGIPKLPGFAEISYSLLLLTYLLLPKVKKKYFK